MSRKRTPNEATHQDNEVRLVLPQGGQVVLDASDYELVRHLRWQRGARGHVVAQERGCTVMLGRFLLDLPSNAKQRVVHKNGNLLDNRRVNLATKPWPPCQAER